jgi:hypothetical protein
MNLTHIFSLISINTFFINLIGWILPFLLGLFSSFIIDSIRNRIKRKRNKTFIKMYLKETILSELPELQKAYENVKSRINNYSDENLKISVFESFNTNVLNGITPVEYYEIFNEKYTILNEIITTIEFLSNNLPIKINSKYYDYINSHLREKEKIGDLEHEKTCPVCISHRNIINGVIDLRIGELNKLKSKILKITN